MDFRSSVNEYGWVEKPRNIDHIDLFNQLSPEKVTRIPYGTHSSFASMEYNVFIPNYYIRVRRVICHFSLTSLGGDKSACQENSRDGSECKCQIYRIEIERSEFLNINRFYLNSTNLELALCRDAVSTKVEYFLWTKSLLFFHTSAE